MRRCLLRRTQSARCHIFSLLFASWYSPVSEFKMAALCTRVIFSGSAPPSVWLFSLDVLGCAARSDGGASEKWKRSLLLRWSRSRADAQDEATQGLFNNLLLYQHTACIQLHGSCSQPYLSPRHVITLVLVGDRLSLLWFHNLLSQGRAADIVWGSSVAALADHMGEN